MIDPRYAVAVIIEHGMHGAAGAPIARDMITYMYDRKRAEDRLRTLEEGWGGTIEQRMQAKADAWAHRDDPKAAAPPALVPAPAVTPAEEPDE